MALRVGLIGFGLVAAQVHLPLLLQAPQVVVAAISEPDAALREEAQRRAPGARAYLDYGEMLEQERLDAVVVCLPTSLLASAGRQVLARGLALYLEKPMACNLQEAQELVNFWETCKPRPVAMVGFNFRRAPIFVELREQLASGRLGRMQHLHSVNSRHAMKVPNWKRKRATGGGVLLDLATHHLDLWEFLLGQRISQMSAQLLSLRSEHDTAAVQAIAEDGVTCSGFFSFDSVDEDRFQIYGQKGCLSVERMADLRVKFKPSSSRFVRLKALAEQAKNLLALPRLLERYRAPWSCSSYQRSLEVFLRGVAEGRSVTPDLYDGLRALELLSQAESQDN